MRAAGWLLPAVLALAPVTGCAASGHDFDAVVAAVQTRYPAHLQRVPMMGLVSFCARMVTANGVKGMKVAEFDNFRNAPRAEDVDGLVSNVLGDKWHRFVTERNRSG